MPRLSTLALQVICPRCGRIQRVGKNHGRHSITFPQRCLSHRSISIRSANAAHADHVDAGDNIEIAQARLTIDGREVATWDAAAFDAGFNLNMLLIFLIFGSAKVIGMPKWWGNDGGNVEKCYALD